MKLLKDTRYVYTKEELCHKLGINHYSVHSMHITEWDKCGEGTDGELVVTFVTEGGKRENV